MGDILPMKSCASNLVEGDTNGSFDIFQYDRLTHRTTRLSLSSAGIQADGGSSRAYLSSDGRYLSFDSDAENLVSGDINQHRDVFVCDRGPLTNAYLPVVNR